jgi:hypothetical protein
VITHTVGDQVGRWDANGQVRAVKVDLHPVAHHPIVKIARDVDWPLARTSLERNGFANPRKVPGPVRSQPDGVGQDADKVATGTSAPG